MDKTNRVDHTEAWSDHFIVHPDYIIENRARDTYQTLLEYIARMRSEEGLFACPGK